MLSAVSAAALSLSGSAVVRPHAPMQVRTSAVTMETKADLEALAKELNPVVGFWDPLGLADPGGNVPDAQFIGFLRHAEIKHGRVAMAAFVGYTVQANGICFPWALTGGAFGGPEVTFAEISAAGGPADQWDALPTLAKLQIFGFIFLAELWGESSAALELSGEKHYINGGKPGFYPSLKKGGIPHPVPLDLWDPFGFTAKMTPERKAKALRAEINNGRLAMIGIMGYVSASKGLIVPGLDGVGIPAYSGEVMAPFSQTDASWPVVAEMLKWQAPY